MSFREEGYHAVLIKSLYENPFEHSTMDKIDTIDFTFLEKITRGVLATVLTLAQEDTLTMDK